MKAVVLEVRDGTAAVLLEDGTVEKIRRECTVGETIEISRKNSRPAVKRAARAAVAAIVILGMLGGGWSYQTVFAYSYVTLDIDNTSLEYTLNRRDQVIDVTAKNEDSREVADQLREDGIRSKEIGDAIRQTVELMDMPEESMALVAVTSGSDSRAEKLRQEASEELQSENFMDFEAHTATREERKQAEERGMSTGRFQDANRSENTPREQPEPGEAGQKQPGGENDQPEEVPATDPKPDGTERQGTEYRSEQPQPQPETQEAVPPQNGGPQEEAPQGGQPDRGENPQNGSAPAMDSVPEGQPENGKEVQGGMPPAP